MPVHSAGIVLWRPDPDHTAARSSVSTTQILLVHPGGPFWAGKDEHGWSIPKGEFDPATESALDAARREFAEELGRPVPAATGDAPPIEMTPFKAGRKVVHPVLIGADFDPEPIVSNLIELEWPPRSGRRIEVPEIDRAQWFRLDEAATKLHKGQAPLVKLVTDTLGL